MTERPILFNGAMVRAILDGSKTQTRRPVKVQPGDVLWGSNGLEWSWLSNTDGGTPADFVRCPFGVPGDRLWVRETWAPDPRAPGVPCVAVHRATDEVALNAALAAPDRWHPSIHMPRWASRITLEVTDVRVERVQDITEEDAQAEGARRFDSVHDTNPYGLGPRWSMETPTSTAQCMGTARMAFANLWERINGTGGWSANPWVWAISFRRVDAQGGAA